MQLVSLFYSLGIPSNWNVDWYIVNNDIYGINESTGANYLLYW